MARKKLFGTVAVILLVGLTIGYWVAHKHAYPYGAQPAALPIVLNALRSYAADHRYQFPNIGDDPYRSLQALYPDYVSADYLAGISGDHKVANLALSTGGSLSSNVSSLVYIPGLSLTNDPRIAIVWEKRAGVAFNGRRHPGRAVGFISGEVKQVYDTEWLSFMSHQAALRSPGVTNRE